MKDNIWVNSRFLVPWLLSGIKLNQIRNWLIKVSFLCNNLYQNQPISFQTVILDSFIYITSLVVLYISSKL